MTVTHLMARAAKPWPAILLVTVLMAASTGGDVRAADGDRIQGAWHPDVYVMKDGVRRDVDGVIVFSGSEWVTLFFIRNGSELERGAGEGGTYTLEGDQLTLRHRLHLSGGQALPNVPETAPLKMEAHGAADAPVEPCRIELSGDRLTLFFPTGNQMSFSRVAGR